MDFIQNLIAGNDMYTDHDLVVSESVWVIIIELIAILILVYIGCRMIKGPEKSFQEGIVDKVTLVVNSIQNQIYYCKQLVNNVFRSQEWKYQKPWYLLVGSENSEEGFIYDCLKKRQVTDELSLEEELVFTSGKVLSLNNGVLISLRRDLSRGNQSRKDGKAKSGDSPPNINNSLMLSKLYQSLVKELIQVRPQRALDGIVLVVSANELLDDGKKESERFSIVLAERIRIIQRLVEFSLPVYLLVSETQEIKCFGNFWKAQSTDFDKQQAFGWESPHDASIIFREEHLDEAFNTIADRLNTIQLQTELASNEQHSVDDFLGFPKKLLACSKPLRRLALQIFHTNPVSKYLLFRGVHFCGRLENTEDGMVGGEKVDAGQTVAFIDKLVDEVIFGAGLQAEPTRKRILSRNVYVFRFQMFMVAAALLMFSSLYFSNRHLDSQIDSITEVVKSVQVWKTDSLAACENLSSSNEVYSLLSNMANLDGRPIYWNLPLSWTETVSSLTDKNLLNNGMNKIVLPNVECHLQAQSKKLSQITTLVDTGKGNTLREESDILASKVHIDELDHYIEDVIEFETNLNDFFDIVPKRTKYDSGEPPMSVFIRLLESIYREKVPKILNRKNGQHNKSLVSQDYPLQWQEVYSYSDINLNRSEYCNNNPTLKKFDSRHPIAIALIASNVCMLAERVYNGIISGAGVMASNENTTSEVLHDLIVKKPKKAYELVKEWGGLASKFVVQNGVEFSTPCTRVRLHMQQFSYSLSEVYQEDEMVLFEPALELFSESGDCEKTAKSNIKKVESALANVGVSEGEGIKSDISLFLATSENKKYFSQPELFEDRALKCKENLGGWDIGSLSLAESYIREYHDMVDENEWHGLDVSESPLKRLAYNRLGSAISQVLYSSQNSQPALGFELNVLSEVTVKEAHLSSVGVNFNRAITHIIPITKDLSALGLKGLSTALTKCSRAYAKDIVNRVQRFSSPLGLYRELPQVSQNLPLNSDYSFTLYNKSDIEDYLDSEQKRTRIVLSYIESALVLLGETEHIEGYDWQAERHTIAFWRNTLRDFSSYQRKLVNTQLGDLQALYTRLGSDENLCENITSLPIGGFGYDLFTKRRSQLVVSLSQMCQTQLVEAVSQNYLFIFNDFNQRFENRYPFTLDRTSTDQASASEFRAFLIANGGAIENLIVQTELLKEQSKRWKDIHSFLTKISDLKQIFSSSLAHEPQSRPLYLSTQFDLSKGENLVSSQATTWTFSTPRYSITNTDLVGSVEDGGLSPQLIWAFGDELSISVDWSKDSPYMVVDETDSRGGLSQYSKTFTQTLKGDWSLLRLMDLYRADDKSDSLLVNVPLKIDPKLQGKTAYKNLGSHPISVPLYLSVQAFAPNAQGVLELVTLPKQFPVFAPPLPGDYYVHH